MEGQRITLDPTAHTSFAERLAAAERARAGRGAPLEDEAERKGATTLFLYGALLVACAAVAGQTEFDEALERVAADAVLKLAHGGGVALVWSVGHGMRIACAGARCGLRLARDPRGLQPEVEGRKRDPRTGRCPEGA